MHIETIILATELQDLSSGPAANQHQRDIAAYIADMLMEMRMMAEQAQLGKAVRAVDAAYYADFVATGRGHTKEG